MGLSQNSNIISCVTLTAKNCETVDANSLGPDFLCSQCLPFFYPSGRQCIAITNQITNCKYYADDSTCSKCANNMFVSFTGKECVPTVKFDSLIDSKCDNSVMSYSCGVCEFGFYKIANGTCMACNTNSQNCLQCDPYSPNKCIICASNYNQLRNGTRVSNNGASTSTSNQTDPTVLVPTNTTPTSKIENLTVVLILLYGILLIF